VIHTPKPPEHTPRTKKTTSVWGKKIHGIPPTSKDKRWAW